MRTRESSTTRIRLPFKLAVNISQSYTMNYSCAHLLTRVVVTTHLFGDVDVSSAVRSKVKVAHLPIEYIVLR